MVFQSRLPKIDPPVTDVFNFIFNTARKEYPRDRVLYRVHETGETLTLDELQTQSRRLATVLVKNYDIKPNTVVAFLAQNSIKYTIGFFAALAAGATISPIPIQQGLDALAVIPRLQETDAKLIITDEAMTPMAKEAAKACNGVPLISLDGTPEGIANMKDLLLGETELFDGFHLTTKEETQVHYAFIFRTSGSSGNVKSLLTTHAHWVTNLLTTRLTIPEDTDPEKDVWMSTVSFSYGINAKLILGLNILLGIPAIILMNPFDESTFHLIDQYCITFLFVTPPLAAKIAKQEKRHDATYKSIKWLLCAGAPVHTKIRDAVQEKFNGVRLSLEWGTTETLLIALQIDDASSVPGSSGTLVHGMEARVLDITTGQDLSHNKHGEILVRNTLARFAGYKDNPEANKSFGADGWFRTGDVGYIDETSNVFIVDRLKELLRVGDGYGSHASADEFEAALFDHPAVATAVVVGIRDEDTQQEHPTAFIILQPEVTQTGDVDKEQLALSKLAVELETHVENKLGKFKRLSGGAYFVEKYPYVGFKINRRRLKELVHVGPTVDRSARFVAAAAATAA
ncbi:4-coumarate-CoA ligase [Tolypocladium capitatum]|uniref:4-coumarate-CoA ligase n=1 Tax=Tolypocladium capitatum TaxID=45235 RepID=A0A2K3QAJ9_9HYPO|nr:4-coumarate-CoA ligase [Tolypocladium capitatum]